jgi:hypothetical protein
LTEAGSPVICTAADTAAPLEPAADGFAEDDPADEAAAADVAALLLVDELVPDEQAASARPAAASPAMSFRLRARRTLFSSSALHVTPVGGTVDLADGLSARWALSDVTRG